ncbi:MAG TPA: hypothetical protein VF870_07430 [Ignavibacteriaceae bacterium]
MYSIKYLVIVFVFSAALVYPQSKYKVEGSLGIISPFNSSSGLTGSLQINHSLNENLQLFLNGMYGQWDKYNIYYIPEFSSSEYQYNGPYKTYSADNHSLFSVNLGARFFLHENKIINLLFDAQIGLSMLSYNEYDLNEFEYPTGQIVLVPDLNSAVEVNETLFALGFGPVFERKINPSLSLYLSAKINTMLNAGDTELLSKRGTYFLVSAGFTHAI